MLTCYTQDRTRYAQDETHYAEDGMCYAEGRTRYAQDGLDMRKMNHFALKMDHLLGHRCITLKIGHRYATLKMDHLLGHRCITLKFGHRYATLKMDHLRNIATLHSRWTTCVTLPRYTQGGPPVWLLLPRSTRSYSLAPPGPVTKTCLLDCSCCTAPGAAA